MRVKNYDVERMFSPKNIVRNVAFPFESDKIGERTLYISEKALEGKTPDEIRMDVQRSYEAFRRAEEWVQAQERSYTDEEALRLANIYYGAVHALLVANCLSVYSERLKEDIEKARAEQKYLDEFNQKDVDELLPEAVQKTAAWLCETWLKNNGPEHAKGLVLRLNFHVEKQLAAAAILKADENVPHDAPKEVWKEAFDKHLREEIGSSTNYVFSAYIQYEAQDILENDIKPAEMPFERLRLWAGVTWLEGMVEGRELSEQLTSEASSRALVTRKLAEYMNGPLASREESLMEQFHTHRNGSHELVYARSRPDLPRGTPGIGHRITSAQMDLMIYILLSSYENLEGERPIIWSPKAYLRRSPTKSEAAALSRRVSSLAYHGLVKKSGREVSITDVGKALIRAYTMERSYDKDLSNARLVLELNETWKSLEALKVVSDAARRHGRYDLAHRDGRGALHDLFLAEVDHKNKLIQQLKDIARQPV